MIGACHGLFEAALTARRRRWRPAATRAALGLMFAGAAAIAALLILGAPDSSPC